MRVKQSMILSIAALGLAFAPSLGFASEVDQEVGSNSTEVGVKITAPPLWLMEISNLDFGQYYVGDTSASAKNDLTIKLKDNRENSNSLWRLSLKVSPFKATSGEDLGNAKIYFKNAKVIKGSTVENGFDNEEFNGEPNQLVILTKQMEQTGKGEYEYTVASKDIKMSLPAVSQPGKYKATMDWVITDAVQ